MLSSKHFNDVNKNQNQNIYIHIRIFVYIHINKYVFLCVFIGFYNLDPHRNITLFIRLIIYWSVATGMLRVSTLSYKAKQWQNLTNGKNKMPGRKIFSFLFIQLTLVISI